MKLATLILALWVGAVVALANHGVRHANDLIHGIPAVVRG